MYLPPGASTISRREQRMDMLQEASAGVRWVHEDWGLHAENQPPFRGEQEKVCTGRSSVRGQVGWHVLQQSCIRISLGVIYWRAVSQAWFLSDSYQRDSELVPEKDPQGPCKGRVHQPNRRGSGSAHGR